MQLDYVTFNQRADRSRYIADRFSKYLSGNVLDVGCDKAVLRDLVAGIEYTGIDVAGTPDIVLNLDQVDRLPFDDNAFNCTVCSDVLEHLDNLHFIFSELVRVTRNHLIISLPNNWANARRPIERGKGSIAHYGLPSTRPADRHKWFFGFSEAVEFAKDQERHLPIGLQALIANDKPRVRLIRLLRNLRYGRGNRYLNRYAHTVWAIYAKHSSS